MTVGRGVIAGLTLPASSVIAGLTRNLLNIWRFRIKRGMTALGDCLKSNFTTRDTKILHKGHKNKCLDFKTLCSLCKIFVNFVVHVF